MIHTKKYIKPIFIGVIVYCVILFISGILDLISLNEILNAEIESLIYTVDVFKKRLKTILILCFISIYIIGIILILMKKKTNSTISKIILQISFILLSVGNIVISIVSIYHVNNLKKLSLDGNEITDTNFSIQQSLDVVAKTINLPLIIISIMIIIYSMMHLISIKNNENNISILNTLNEETKEEQI